MKLNAQAQADNSLLGTRNATELRENNSQTVQTPACWIVTCEVGLVAQSKEGCVVFPFCLPSLASPCLSHTEV
jgi:hypothetical protein